MKSLDFVRGEIVEIGFARPGEAAVGAHPEIALAIFQQAPDRVIEKTVFDPVGRELSIFISNQAGAKGPEPHYVVRIFIDTGCASGQKAGIFKALKFAIFQARQAFFRAKPDSPCMILKDDPDAVGPPIFLGKDCKFSIFVAGQPAVASTDPPVPFPVAIKRMNGVARKAVFDGIAADDPALAHDLHAIFGTDEHGAVYIFCAYEYRVVRLVGAKLDGLNFSIPQDAQSLVGADPNALIAALVHA